MKEYKILETTFTSLMVLAYNCGKENRSIEYFEEKLKNWKYKFLEGKK